MQVQSEIRNIGPETAKEILGSQNFRLQRRIKPSQIGALTTAMKDGDFPAGTAIYFGETPEKKVLIDGQHRLFAQVSAGVDIEYAVITLVCKDDNEVQIAYTQLDIGTKRSISDRMRALDLTGHISLPGKQANALAAGAPFLKYRFGKMTSRMVSNLSPVQRLELCKEYEAAAAEFFKCIGTAEKWIQEAFMRPHFVALGVFLFHHSPEKALYLWSSLASNSCGTENDPRRRIFNMSMNVKSTAIALHRSLVVAQAFLRGWNDMMEDKKVKSVLTPAPIPAEKVSITGIDLLPMSDAIAEKAAAFDKHATAFAEMAKQFPLAVGQP